MVSSSSKRSDTQVVMPPPVARALRSLGDDLSIARRMRRLTQEDLAQRKGRKTADDDDELEGF